MYFGMDDKALGLFWDGCKKKLFWSPAGCLTSGQKRPFLSFKSNKFECLKI